MVFFQLIFLFRKIDIYLNFQLECFIVNFIILFLFEWGCFLMEGIVGRLIGGIKR